VDSLASRRLDHPAKDFLVYLNPDTGQAIYAGYLVHGISTSLFNGAPGEGTACFKFKTPRKIGAKNV
jgi:hypothetical protein